MGLTATKETYPIAFPGCKQPPNACMGPKTISPSGELQKAPLKPSQKSISLTPSTGWLVGTVLFLSARGGWGVGREPVAPPSPLPLHPQTPPAFRLLPWGLYRRLVSEGSLLWPAPCLQCCHHRLWLPVTVYPGECHPVSLSTAWHERQAESAYTYL